MNTGRPRAFTEAKRRQLSSFICEGFTLEQAARFLGCSLRTLRREMKRDPQLAHEVADAELSAQLDPEKHLHRAAAQNWRAAAWILERTQPQRYGRYAPRGIVPEAVAEGMRRLIEVALGLFVDSDARNRAYDRLMAASDEITAALVNPGSLRRLKKLTPHIDAAEFDAMVQDQCRAHEVSAADLSPKPDKSPAPTHPGDAPYPQRPTGVTPTTLPEEAESFVTKTSSQTADKTPPRTPEFAGSPPDARPRFVAQSRPASHNDGRPVPSAHASAPPTCVPPQLLRPCCSLSPRAASPPAPPRSSPLPPVGRSP